MSELRIYYAKGYRVYLKDIDGEIVLLINGGDKAIQKKNIAKAKEIWNNYNK